MKKNKKIILIVGAALLVISLLLIVDKLRLTPPSLTPRSVTELKHIQTLPKAGKNQLIHPSTGIVFTFDSPLYLPSAGVSIEPKEEVVVEISKSNSSALIVRPKNEWKIGTAYTIKIKKGLLSLNNYELKEDIIYQVLFEKPKDITVY